jgi:hypothetical protein
MWSRSGRELFSKLRTVGLSPDGKRIVALMPANLPEGENRQSPPKRSFVAAATFLPRRARAATGNPAVPRFRAQMPMPLRSSALLLRLWSLPARLLACVLTP